MTEPAEFGPKEAPLKHEDIVARINQRAEERGVKDILRNVRRPETHFSSLELALIAEELETSVHFLLTGRPDPYQVRLIRCTNPYPFDD